MTMRFFRWSKLLRPAAAMFAAAAISWSGQNVVAQEPGDDGDSEAIATELQPDDDRPPPRRRDAGPPRDRGPEDRGPRDRGPRDGDRKPDDRGPRDGDRDPGDRGPRDGDRKPDGRGPRDGDRGPGDRRGPEDRGPSTRGPADHGPPSGRGFGGGGFGGGREFGGARGFGGPMPRFTPPGRPIAGPPHHEQGSGSLDERIARLEHKLDAILMELHQLHGEHYSFGGIPHAFGAMAQRGPAMHGMGGMAGGMHPPMGAPPFARSGRAGGDHQGPPHMQGPPHGPPPHFGPPRGERRDGPRDRDDDDDRRGRADRDHHDSDRDRGPPPRGAQRERGDDELGF